MAIGGISKRAPTTRWCPWVSGEGDAGGVISGIARLARGISLGRVAGGEGPSAPT